MKSAEPSIESALSTARSGGFFLLQLLQHPLRGWSCDLTDWHWTYGNAKYQPTAVEAILAAYKNALAKPPTKGFPSTGTGTGTGMVGVYRPLRGVSAAPRPLATKELFATFRKDKPQ